jgi:hypothetical protein
MAASRNIYFPFGALIISNAPFEFRVGDDGPVRNNV